MHAAVVSEEEEGALSEGAGDLSSMRGGGRGGAWGDRGGRRRDRGPSPARQGSASAAGPGGGAPPGLAICNSYNKSAHEL